MNLEGDKFTANAFVDLKDALDTVNHEKLQQKLDQYDIGNTEVNWFCSYSTKKSVLLGKWKASEYRIKKPQSTAGVLSGASPIHHLYY